MIGIHMLHRSPSPTPRAGRPPAMVRVQAHTALPIVKAVPKCSADSKRERRRASGRHSSSRRPEEADDRVLLILNDDPVRGGGIPVIGRRLPSKSMSLYRQLELPTSRVLDFSQPASIQVDNNYLEPIQRNPEAPVVGRRSHRLLMEQQCNPTVYHYDNQPPPSQQIRRTAEQKVARRDLFVPSTEKIAAHKKATMPSSSRSLVSIPQPAAYQPACCAPDPTTSSEYRTCATCSAASFSQLAPEACMGPCCRPTQPSAIYTETKSARSASCQRLPSSSPLQDKSICQKSNRHNSTNNNNHNHNHHRSCRANESNHRPSSCNDRSCYRSPAAHQQSHGRNVLPVQPKPTLDYSTRLLVADYLSGQNYSPANCTTPRADSTVSEEAAAVNQMYESLAAELKAKLANKSKTAPILLPPKDYDTLSRKQGKLNGIEQRRSTNPMLVGPAANRLNLANCTESNNQANISEEQNQPHLVSVGEGERDSQRSRSNSSSGLGSISMGAGSPSHISPSSSSSSSEDMRHSSPRHSNEPKPIRHEHPLSKADRDTNSDSGQSSSGTGYNESTGNIQMSRDSANYARHSRFSDLSTSSSNAPNLDGHHDRRSYQQAKESGKRGLGIQNHNPSKVSNGILWNGRVEVPLKVNSEKNGNTYLATKQIIY